MGEPSEAAPEKLRGELRAKLRAELRGAAAAAHRSPEWTSAKRSGFQSSATRASARVSGSEKGAVPWYVSEPAWPSPSSHVTFQFRLTSTPWRLSRRERHVPLARSASMREAGTCTGTTITSTSASSSLIRSRERSTEP